ncbi:TM2 domain-containing protein [Corynebacterium heidelbergense]|uniref:TM2 domain-containing protein n=1 Tax=Corynebacterium heidelbergense TaxID=2055947 RepID=A0A364V682_9CORY|nr:TM2 domain-containing protein [Corynebacterium heidelbergense]RAV32160.1 TM2 domain-containing protein [Corynebacterium heidelbergense]
MSAPDNPYLYPDGAGGPARRPTSYWDNHSPGDTYFMATGQPYPRPDVPPYGPSPYGAAPYPPTAYPPEPYSASAYGHQAYDSSGLPIQAPADRPVYEPKSYVAAGLPALFLGPLGVHNFYLGHKKRGCVQLGLTVSGWLTMILLIGLPLVLGVGVWAFAEAILLLTRSRGYDVDAQGVPLI